MLRPVVQLEASQCNACGRCITACPHEALDLMTGSSRLVSEALCTGDGLCVEACGGALWLELREAAPFDAMAVEQHLVKRARLRALAAEE
jgi:Na+-translocating ferredoxin:NAD+ oxidoreductase RNF subunit RnfB